MTWPSTNVPATAPTTHGPVRTQAYQAGGGDYFRTGYYSHGMDLSAAFSSAAMTAGQMRTRPFIVPVRRSFDRLGVNVAVAATAASGGVLRFGIYADGGGVPGTLVVDAGTVSSESIGAKEATISQTLDPGIYWLALACQVAGCTVSCYAGTTTSLLMSPSTTPITNNANHFLATGVTGALPSPYGTPGTPVTGSPYPLVALRAA